MEVRMESKQAAAVKGIETVLTEIHKRLRTDPQNWLQRLTGNPDSFVDLEKTVHRSFQQMADQVVAGLLAQATAGAKFAQAAKKK
jgi:hypothetical protein